MSMGLSQEQAFLAFMHDALRIAEAVSKGLESMSQQVRSFGKPHTASVNEIFRNIHSLKGTSTMVKGAESVAEALHQSEDVLAAVIDGKMARDLDWFSPFQRQVKSALTHLMELEREHRLNGKIMSRPSRGGAVAPVDQGLTLRAELGGRRFLLWFPLSACVLVLSSQELGCRKVISFSGKYIPVLGAASAFQGVVIEFKKMHSVLRASEIQGLQSFADAAKLGAVEGLSQMQMALDLMDLREAS